MTNEEFAKYQFASGKLRHLQSGVVWENSGRIVNNRATAHGIDTHLWEALVHVADSLSLEIAINSVDTGEHAANSRHYDGRAVDIGRVGLPGKSRVATVKNRRAMEVMRYFLDRGWYVGEIVKCLSVPGVIFGPTRSLYNPTKVSHENHLHVSIAKKPHR